MSSLVRSLTSIYCQRLRRTVRLGGLPAAAKRAPELHQPRSFSSMVQRIEASGAGIRRSDGRAADTGGSPAARPPRRQGQHGTARFFTWARLAVGSVVAVMAPFLQSKWATLLRIQSEVEMVKDVTETAAEVLEEVAPAAEKVSAEVAEQLPEHGKLRRAAVLVEHASKEVAEGAHLAQDIIHKVPPTTASTTRPPLRSSAG
ncbi:hypothetical protein E2562_003239 [Oryza meyeriana var. granulata]|uniref:Uncharacterized protein n=1 Tax=Oryza meyeriana var. granulata TaxID=110450 RepID=A0A6G1EV29_9ORYZ|nr:hypothetical protein E2562_003239 [Oryza meyeriana var. granulata]